MLQQSKPTVERISRLRSVDNKHKHQSIKRRRPHTIIHKNIGTPKNICLTSSLHEQLSSAIDDQKNYTKSSTARNPIEFEEGSTYSINATKYHRYHSSISQVKNNGNVIKTSLSQVNNSTKNQKIYQHYNIQGNSKANSSLSKLTKITPYKDIINVDSKANKNDLLDERGLAKDFHQKPKSNKKTKCTRRCIIVSILAAVLLILIIVAILLALLIKPKQTTTISDVRELRWNSTGITVAGISGSSGSNSNQLNTPLDLVLDNANNLYIADNLNHRIQKYMFGSSVGTTMAGNITAGSSSSQLYRPIRVILDSNDNLYISDSINHRIQFWPKDSTSGTTVAGTTGSSGFSSNLLNAPYGIVVNPTSGTLYIADQGNHCIMSYASGVLNGTLLFGGIGAGTNNTQLYSPSGLHFDSFSNSLFVANRDAHNIVRIVFGENTWTLAVGNVSGFSGTTATYLNSPTDAILDPMGNMYVVDRSNHRIQFYYSGQLTGTTIAGITSVSGDNATTLNTPRSVRLDNQLNLYVADANNHRIQKFMRY